MIGDVIQDADGEDSDALLLTQHGRRRQNEADGEESSRQQRRTAVDTPVGSKGTRQINK